MNRTPELRGWEGREAHALKIAKGRLPKKFLAVQLLVLVECLERCLAKGRLRRPSGCKGFGVRELAGLMEERHGNVGEKTRRAILVLS